jgi:hypothetical protein
MPTSSDASTGNRVFDTLARILPYRVQCRLPNRLAVPVLARRNPDREDATQRAEWALDSALLVSAYWLRFGGQQGPAMSVHFRGEEILRIDCLNRSPHVHYCHAESLPRHGDGRVWLPEQPPEALIDRAQFELTRNLQFSLHLHRSRRVQRHPIDDTRLAEIGAEAAAHLRHLVGLNGFDWTTADAVDGGIDSPGTDRASRTIER